MPKVGEKKAPGSAVAGKANTLIFPDLDAGNNRIWAFTLCMIGYISDVLDGFLARKLNQVSELGKIIDPLADKICIVTIIVILFITDQISTLFFAVIVLRDLIIFLGGIYVSKKIDKVLPSNLLGKITVFSIGLYILAVIANLEILGFRRFITCYCNNCTPLLQRYKLQSRPNQQ